MCVDKLLKLEPSSLAVLEVLGLLREQLSDAFQHVFANVIVAESLEHFARKLLSLELRGVDEVAVISSSASLRTVEVLARHGSVVANFDLFVRHFFLPLLLFLSHAFHVFVELLKMSDLVLELSHGVGVVESQLNLSQVGHVVDVLVALPNPVSHVLANLLPLVYIKRVISNPVSLSFWYPRVSRTLGNQLVSRGQS